MWNRIDYRGSRRATGGWRISVKMNCLCSIDGVSNARIETADSADLVTGLRIVWEPAPPGAILSSTATATAGRATAAGLRPLGTGAAPGRLPGILRNIPGGGGATGGAPAARRGGTVGSSTFSILAIARMIRMIKSSMDSLFHGSAVRFSQRRDWRSTRASRCRPGCF